MLHVHKVAVGLLLSGGIALAASVTTPSPAAAQQKAPTIVPNLLCPFGCGPTESDTMLNTMMARGGESVVLAAQETPGYVYNIRAMADKSRWNKAIFGTEDTVIQLAMQGGSPELKEFLPDQIPIKFKLLYGDGWWFQGKLFLTFDPNIKNLKDAKGKRISLGLRTQSDFGVFSRLLLEHGYGITMKDADIRHLTPPAMTQQLIDGVTDVITTSLAGEPTGKNYQVGGLLRQVEAAGKKIHYVNVDKEAIDKLNKKFGTTFLHHVIPAGTLPMQDKEVHSAFNRGFKGAHESLPDDVAYQIVKAIAKYAPSLRDQHFLWKIWSPELMLHGLSDENVHPGAKKAYVELGWWDKHKQFPPMTYPNVK